MTLDYIIIIVNFITKNIKPPINMLSQGILFKSSKSMFKIAARSFGAMDQVNKEMFEHKFTNDMDFRSSFDKLKCFRVMDEDGNIINRRYEGSIDDNTMQKMFRTMVMMNEADVVYNQA